jgi:UDP-GlcNAc:undecaprenyl-phosphate GlcNAc-1-phosphate transferase
MKGLSLPLYLGVFAGGSLVSLILTPLVRRLALAHGMVATPRDTRWHKKETALLGGVSIFLATAAAWSVSAGLSGWVLHGQPILPFMICAAAMFSLGLADDFFDMAPQQKLAVQVVIGSLFVFLGFRLNWTPSQTVNLMLSILWILGMTNAFNLLDNMDGLAAGIAFIAGSFLFLWHLPGTGEAVQFHAFLLLNMAYLGALLGFLVYNFNPASIFMGDAGSLFIGFVLGGLSMTGSAGLVQTGTSVPLLSVITVPVLILFVPILDTGFVSLMRKLFRRPISQGGRDHSSHRMVAIGFSEKRAVLVLYAFSIFSGCIALAINRLSIGTSVVTVALYLLLVLFFWIYLGKVKVYAEESILQHPSGITPVLIEITYRRRLLEVILDLILIAVAYYAAYLLRFEGDLGPDFQVFLKSLPVLISCQILSFFLTGVYRGVWEATGLRDLIVYIKAITSGTIGSMLILLFFYRFYSFSRAVFVIYWVLMLILMSLTRLSFRLLDEGVRKRNRHGRPTLIYGAGVGGQLALKEIESNGGLGLNVVGFIDDNPRIHRRSIKGYPVLGDRQHLKEIIAKHGVKEIIVTFKVNGSEKAKEVKKACQEMGSDLEVKQMNLMFDVCNLEKEN